MKIIGAGGGGKSGGSGRAAREDTDSLQSVSYASVLDVVSEGEIQGLVNGLHSVYLDGTPLVDDVGNFNFKGVSVDYRVGTQYQTPINGFDTASNEVVVGIQVRQSTPVVRTVSNSQINSLIVKISIPQLTKQNTSTGDLTGSEVQFAIEVNSNGSGWVQKLNDKIVGKSSSKYVKSYRIDLPAVGPHQVRIRRVTEDSTTSAIQNSLYWESYSEIVNAKFSYPNSALFAVRVDAENFSNIPNRAYDLYLLKIKVPTNYDPIGRVYTGLWNGTFKIAWTDNPAWILYDLLTSTRYGAGIDSTQIDKWAFYKIGQYCDEFVDNGFGTVEPRFTCNCYLQTREEAFKVIRDLASVFRGIVYWQGGLLTATQDSPQDPAYLFTPSNVIDGEFIYQGSSRKDRYSVAMVSWNDPADAFQTKIEYVDDPEAIAKFGVVEKEVSALGCTSRGQAHRVGKWMIFASQFEAETVIFKTGIEAANCRPGQIILIQDPMRAGGRMGGRVSSTTSGSLTIDQDITLDLLNKTYTLSASLPDGTIVNKTVISQAGRALTFSTPFTVQPHRNSVWILASNDLQPQMFRVISVGESNNQYMISAISHNPTKYDYVEKGLSLAPRSISNLAVTPDTPTSLSLTETLYESNGDVKVKVSFSWASTANAATYNVEYRRAGGNIVYLGETKTNDFEILNVDPTLYDFFVTAYSVFGGASGKAQITYEVKGKAFPPGDVQGLSVVPLSSTNMAVVSWEKTVDLDVAIGGFVRIRYSPLTGVTWKDTVDVTVVAGSSTSAQVPLMDGTYLAKFVDSSGNSSNSPAIVVTSALETNALNVVATVNESSSWPGTKSNMFYSSFYTGLMLSSNVLIDAYTDPVDTIAAWDFLGGVVDEGSYQFNSVVDLTEVYSSNLVASLEASSVDVADSIDMRTDLIDTWADLDGVFIDDVNAEIYVQTTNDDPASGGAVWSNWNRFFVGQYTARGFRFKVVATSLSANHNIIIRNLAITLDMPDRTINLSNLSSSTVGTNVVFEKAFAAVPSIGITASNLNSGDYYAITSKTNAGFTITFYNSAGAAITRNFDVIAKGYGRKAS